MENQFSERNAVAPKTGAEFDDGMESRCRSALRRSNSDTSPCKSLHRFSRAARAAPRNRMSLSPASSMQAESACIEETPTRKAAVRVAGDFPERRRHCSVAALHTVDGPNTIVHSAQHTLCRQGGDTLQKDRLVLGVSTLRRSIHQTLLGLSVLLSHRWRAAARL